jgi:hypothetical protein
MFREILCPGRPASLAEHCWRQCNNGRLKAKITHFASRHAIQRVELALERADIETPMRDP